MTLPAAACRAPSEAPDLQGLRLAIEASGEIIFTTDCDGVFTYVNPEFERVYGYGPSELLGRVTPRILKGGTTDSDEYAAFWSRLRQKQVVRSEFRNRTKSGSIVDIETSANPIVDASGAILGYVAVQHDVTERKRLEAAVSESEQRYRTLASAAPDSIFIVNDQARIEYANDICASRFGLTADQITGKRLQQVFPAVTADEIWRAVSSVLSAGRRELFEQKFVLPAGELWLETWMVPLRSDESRTTSVMGVARDITTRKHLERDLLQAQKMEAIGLLAGGVAHDFNNLLTAILGYCELLSEAVSDRPAALDDLEEVVKAAQRATRLTRQLLGFSRKQPIHREQLDLTAVVRDVHRMLTSIIRESIQISLTAEADAWLVMADRGQIEQVILNLAVNARDAMPKGGSLAMEISNARLDDAFAGCHAGAVAGAFVALSIRDTGCGMDAATLNRAFEPFFTTKPQGHGTGLGLSTVYGIVKEHGGHITIDSRLGEGTVVTVYLPKSGVANAQLPASLEPGSADGAETVLIVEDQPAIRSLMRTSLERHGYDVLEARDPSDALRIVAEHAGPIHLLLSDVIMPGMNGPDLAQRIVGVRPEIKILYVSGFPNTVLPREPIARTRMAFLAKPFTPQALARKVRECLNA